MATSNVTILVESPHWKGLKPTVARAAEALLAQQKLKKAAVTILLTTDAAVKELNRDYRGKNKPTNVLSFENGAEENGIQQLGDIVLAYETIAREAEEQGKKLKDHLTHLVIHGILHLLGYDHLVPKDADIMETYEIRILARMGIANPYEST